ncbi:alpha/beta hydrolase [Nitrosomonas sp. Nm33]|uniref:alpha/beta hydrolase n=1 Tax=Nitrosomonas sp. Nm33 TaxID=133724 RepID=UPI000894D5C1|nr:alpha/beta hydrolase [Nitrosomonas sp. Nm33]SDY68636.1 phospholipase/carboxylesterase [Nitrosomonas sp. Nm33]
MPTPSSQQLPAIELETSVQPTHTILWMHGLGADGNDFVPIIHELDLPPDTAIRFIFPHAPKQPVSINQGLIMRAWYDIKNINLNQYEDEAGIRSSQHAITAMIERENQRGIPSTNIVLAGFSQGGVIALQVGLRHPDKLGGIMVLSSYLPLAHTLTKEAHNANTPTSIFMAHGSYDPIVPIHLAKTSRQQLLEAGYQVEWHEYPMEHSVCAEELTDISKWLRQVLR